MEKSQALIEIAKGGTIVFITYMAVSFFDLFYKVIIARVLSIGDYGTFSLAIGIIGILLAFSRLGFTQAFRKFIPDFRVKGEYGKIKNLIIFGISTSFLFSLFISCIFIIFSSQIAEVFDISKLENLIKIFAILLPFYTGLILISDILVSFKRAKERMIVEIFGRGLLTLVLSAFALYYKRDLIFFSYFYVTSYIINFFFYYIMLEKKVFSLRKIQMKKIAYKRILKFSIPLLFVGIIAIFMRRSDMFLIGYFKTEREVGLYNAAFPLASTLLFFIQSFNMLFYPVASELYAKRNYNDLAEVYKTVTRWIFLLTFPIFLLYVFFSKDFISLFFGSKYISAHGVLIILCIGMFVNAFFGAVGILLQVYEKQNFIFKTQVLGVILNILLNIVLIPRYGIEGAAFATSFSMILWNVIFFLKVKTILKVRFHILYYGKYFVSALSSLSVFFILTHIVPKNMYTLILMTGIYLFFYGFFILLTKSITKEDLEILLAFERKTGLNLRFLKRIIKRFL